MTRLEQETFEIMKVISKSLREISQSLKEQNKLLEDIKESAAFAASKKGDNDG